MKKSNLNFLLYGEGSFLNNGCEAIVNTTTKKVRAITDGNIVLSTHDMNDRNKYKDVITKCVCEWRKDEELSDEDKEKLEHYKNIQFDYRNFEKIHCKDVLEEVTNSDICLSIGGDNYCYGEPNWLFTIDEQIAKENKKNILWSTSLFEEIESREMIRDLKNFDLIVTRESLTYNALSKIIDKERLMLEPDTAFSLATKETELPKIFDDEVIGINISPLIMQYSENKDVILESIKKVIDYVLAKTSKNVCLIPHVYIEGNNDLDALKLVKEIYKDEQRVYLLDGREYDAEEIKFIISKCRTLIAARTHASIAAYSTNVPTLVIGYSVKSKGIALDLFGEYENYVVSAKEIMPEVLLEKYKFIEKNRNKIIKILKDKNPELKKRSDNALAAALERLEELDKKYVINNSRCTGCMACYNVCPHGAIEVYKNEEGFLATKINTEKCTKCGLCKKVCPVNQNYKRDYSKPAFYAAKSKEEEERMNSSSGGVFAKLAAQVLKEKGAVYGATLEKDKTKHIRIDSAKDLHKIMGSKYVQSDTKNIYKDIKADLDKKKKVLLSGTPCQIEGIKSYIGDDENLVCVSVACHGVPSPEIFNKYVKESGDIINFRNKENGWHQYNVEYEQGEKHAFTKDDYMNGFLKNYFLRESCYNCQMKYYDKNRADIILGDFWGIENVFEEMDDDKGVSAVIINSEKGKNIFESVRESIDYKETTLEDITLANPAIIKPAEYTKNRDEFFELIKSNEVKTAIGYLVYRNDKSKDEQEEMKKYIKDLEEAKEYFISQISTMQEELEAKEEKLKSIYASRTWKYRSKVANAINKLRGK